jgi:hypothetical protein
MACVVPDVASERDVFVGDDQGGLWNYSAPQKAMRCLLYPDERGFGGGLPPRTCAARGWLLGWMLFWMSEWVLWDEIEIEVQLSD